jgi:hypothetical protein
VPDANAVTVTVASWATAAPYAKPGPRPPRPTPGRSTIGSGTCSPAAATR